MKDTRRTSRRVRCWAKTYRMKCREVGLVVPVRYGIPYAIKLRCAPRPDERLK